MENKEDVPITYGTIVVLGSSSYDVSGEKVNSLSKSNEIFVLKKKQTANGLKEVTESVLNYSSLKKDVPLSYRTISSTHTMSICYKDNERTFIEFEPSSSIDMFQFGRKSKNDFVIKGACTANGHSASRYSFRIECDREPPYSCRLYAGGFDESNNLFLGPSALTWNGDGLITNGVRIFQPGVFHSSISKWIEISCRGNAFEKRPTSTTRGSPALDATNVLIDGTLINAGGITMMWRSSTPDVSLTRDNIESNLMQQKIICPINLTLIRFGRMALSNRESMLTSDERAGVSTFPKVYPACGHVHGSLEQPLEKCSICRTPGPFTDLKLEPTEVIQVFFSEHPLLVFNPCGHMIDNSAKIWSGIDLPQQKEFVCTTPSTKCCPFCLAPLDTQKPFSKLVYQTE